MPLIFPSNTLSAGGFSVDNSCRFNYGDSAYMHKTFGTGGSTTAWTMSMWVKRGVLGRDNRVFSCDDASDGNPDNYWRFTDDDEIQINILNSIVIGNLITTRVFRDCSAWYHVCVIWNSADGTEGDRIQLWVNGIRETSFSTETYPSQDANSITASQVVSVGRRNYGPQQYFDGYLAEVVFLDGVTASPVGTLGEFDSNSPTIFKPIDVSGLSFGSTGFYLDFEDSANLGNDANGGTDLTSVNLDATDQATDTPTNNFATLNPLVNIGTATTYSEGNLTVSSNDAAYRVSPSTIAVNNGKWYAEFKAVSGHDASTDVAVGIIQADTNFSTSSQNLSAYPNGYSYGSGGLVAEYNASTIYTGSTYTDGDILGVVVDLDNSKLYFHKNGTYENSGDPTSGATGTGAVSITAGKDYYICCSTITAAGTKVFSANFGSPSYANSSDAADADGYGAFEYAPPSGYYALCTKNLAEYG